MREVPSFGTMPCSHVKGNNVKIWALLRQQEKLCSMGPLQQHGGVLPIFETFASLSTVPMTELDTFFSGDQINCVTTPRTGIKGASKPSK